jgi:hemerythrin-like domain-containing protein
MDERTRRAFLHAATAASAGLLFAGCRSRAASAKPPEAKSDPPAASGTPRDEKAEVTANEDLMREHGVLRRALIVYRESAARLRGSPAAVPPDALVTTARLFRAFGEDYHEKKLEEAFVFPAVKKLAGAPSALVDVLVAQHRRGREITDYVLAVASGPKLSANAAELAKALESFARMYEAHAAMEDTVIYPAWKGSLSAKDYEELGDRFEDVERQQFGHDGFEDAVRQITGVENELGIGDLARFTAPPPPRA